MDTATLNSTLADMANELLAGYDRRVTDNGEFPLFSAAREVFFGDPETTLPGRLEIVVMAMKTIAQRDFDTQRFVSVRVVKSPRHGFVSLSCFHGTKDALRASIEAVAANPGILAERVLELAEGLPEETDPKIWR